LAQQKDIESIAEECWQDQRYKIIDQSQFSLPLDKSNNPDITAG
jgi:hypothetical protein